MECPKYRNKQNGPYPSASICLQLGGVSNLEHCPKIAIMISQFPFLRDFLCAKIGTISLTYHGTLWGKHCYLHCTDKGMKLKGAKF